MQGDGLGSYRALCVTIRAEDTGEKFPLEEMKHSGLLIAS